MSCNYGYIFSGIQIVGNNEDIKTTKLLQDLTDKDINFMFSNIKGIEKVVFIPIILKDENPISEELLRKELGIK